MKETIKTKQNLESNDQSSIEGMSIRPSTDSKNDKLKTIITKWQNFVDSYDDLQNNDQFVIAYDMNNNNTQKTATKRRCLQAYFWLLLFFIASIFIIVSIFCFLYFSQNHEWYKPSSFSVNDEDISSSIKILRAKEKPSSSIKIPRAKEKPSSSIKILRAKEKPFTFSSNRFKEINTTLEQIKDDLLKIEHKDWKSDPKGVFKNRKSMYNGVLQIHQSVLNT